MMMILCLLFLIVRSIKSLFKHIKNWRDRVGVKLGTNTTTSRTVTMFVAALVLFIFLFTSLWYLPVSVFVLYVLVMVDTFKKLGFSLEKQNWINRVLTQEESKIFYINAVILNGVSLGLFLFALIKIIMSWNYTT